MNKADVNDPGNPVTLTFDIAGLFCLLYMKSTKKARKPPTVASGPPDFLIKN